VAALIVQQAVVHHRLSNNRCRLRCSRQTKTAERLSRSPPRNSKRWIRLPPAPPHAACARAGAARGSSLRAGRGTQSHTRAVEKRPKPEQPRPGASRQQLSSGGARLSQLPGAALRSLRSSGARLPPEPLRSAEPLLRVEPPSVGCWESRLVTVPEVRGDQPEQDAGRELWLCYNPPTGRSGSGGRS